MTKTLLTGLLVDIRNAKPGDRRIPPQPAAIVINQERLEGILALSEKAAAEQTLSTAADVSAAQAARSLAQSAWSVSLIQHHLMA
jgi:hypothetical protein